MGLYQDVIRVVASDPQTGQSTGELTIIAYGPQTADDRMPIFGLW